MHRTKALLATMALSALCVAPALAQQQATPPPSQQTTAGPGRTAPPPQATTATSTTATSTSANTDTGRTDTGRTAFNGSLVKSHDQWRASKLVGQTVYDENGQTIGTVDDLMVDDSGKISQAVISVGGFLGIGSKLVAVPYDQLKFEPNGNASNNATGNATTGAMSTGATVAEQTANTPTNTNANVNAGMPPPQRPNYYSVVMPGANKNTLTTMNEFRYAG